MRRAGVDIGATAVTSLAWGVFAPTQQTRARRPVGQLRRRDRGRRRSASGSAPMCMYGGSNNSFALQPLSVEGQVGLNVFAGIAGLELRFAP